MNILIAVNILKSFKPRLVTCLIVDVFKKNRTFHKI